MSSDSPRQTGPVIGSEVRLPGYVITEEERDATEIGDVELFFTAGIRALFDVPVPEDVRPRAESYYVVRLATADVLGARAMIAGVGARPVEYVPDAAWIVRMTGEVSERVESLDVVEWVGRYLPEYKESSALRDYLARVPQEALASAGRGPSEPSSHGVLEEVQAPATADERAASAPGAPRLSHRLLLNVHLFPGADIGAATRHLSSAGGTILESAESESEAPRLRITAAPDALPAIYRIDEVRLIEPYSPPQLRNDVAARIMNIPGRNPHGPDGTGQIIGHADSGLDVGDEEGIHADFAGRLAGSFARGRVDDWSDWDGHGTHTAASILGSGEASEKRFQGVAPGAKLVHQSIADASGSIEKGVKPIGHLLDQAFDAGARIHSDSWGINVTHKPSLAGVYGMGSDVDRWSWNGGDPRDMLIVIAAGNDGRAVPKGSVGAPATAKNCLAVGATENDRQALGEDGDDVAQVADFSSRGPVRGGRNKPDVVAPGTWVVSARTRGDRRLIDDGFEGGASGWKPEPSSGGWAEVSNGCAAGSWCWTDSPSGAYPDDADTYLVSPEVAGRNAATLVFRGRWRHVETEPHGVWVLFDAGSGFTKGYRMAPQNRRWPDWDVVVLPLPSGIRGAAALKVAFRMYSDHSGRAEGFWVDDVLLTSLSSWSFLSARGLASFADPLDAGYTLMGGTSMATPLVAGAAAVIRQHLQDELGADPTAELIKATLINGAQKLLPTDPRPNPDSGWGRVDVGRSILPAAPRKVLYADRVSIGPQRSLTIPFVVSDSSEELRATLVWADPPGESLVHDLDLTLVDPSGTAHYIAAERAPNGRNNVEGIDIAAPARGEWTLAVSSSILTIPSQPLAVVISGAVTAAEPE